MVYYFRCEGKKVLLNFLICFPLFVTMMYCMCTLGRGDSLTSVHWPY